VGLAHRPTVMALGDSLDFELGDSHQYVARKPAHRRRVVEAVFNADFNGFEESEDERANRSRMGNDDPARLPPLARVQCCLELVCGRARKEIR